MTTLKKVDAKAITDWAQQCLMNAGAAPEIANAMATHLVAGDLLGFRTHGLLRLRYNLQALQRGVTKAQGQPRVVKARKAIALWDADLLSGLYVMPKAIETAIEMARTYGTGTIVLRRIQHIAALAVYLEQATEQGMLINALCATPAQQVVAPFGAKSACFSPNPFAIGVPTKSAPILLDMSLSMTAAGKVRTAIAEDKPLPYPALITPAGDYTTEARTFLADPASVLASLGGEQLGYKGTGLNLFAECWTLALGQYGRLDADASDEDANSVWIQVTDPDAIGDGKRFRELSSELVLAMKNCTPINPEHPVRVPGEGALATRQRQLTEGVEYTEAVWRQLKWCADNFGTQLPSA